MEKQSYTLQELAQLTKSELVGDPKHLISSVADLKSADSKDASFLSNSRYEKFMQDSDAGVIFVTRETPLITGKNFLVTPNPSQAFQSLAETLNPAERFTSGFENIHPSAVIHPTAVLEKGVKIGPNSVIEKDTTIGANTTLSAQTYLGVGSSIGSNCLLYPQVVIRENCVIGNQVIIQPGTIIGSCGYGYSTNAKGIHTKLAQLGNVVIEDNVEIGANVTIDRGRITSTKVGEGTKIDNLVMLAHGVSVGKHSMLIAQTGVAGSSEIGNHVIIAGQVAINGHIQIADGVMVAGKSAITKSITKPGKYNGIPVIPLNDYNRQSVHIKKLSSYAERIKQLEKRLEILNV